MKRRHLRLLDEEGHQPVVHLGADRVDRLARVVEVEDAHEVVRADREEEQRV